MLNENSIAKIIGALFLIAMAASIAGNGLLLPIITDDNYLETLLANNATVRAASVLMLVNSIAVVSIGVLMYEVLKRGSVFIAVGYLAARVIESVVLIFGVINVLSLIGLAEQFAKAEPASAHLLSAARTAIDNNWYSYQAAMMALGVGSLCLCYVLYQFKLIPRLLSILGVIGYVTLAIASLLAFLDFDLGLVATLPVFVFELVFGAWLITKGFSSTAGRPESDIREDS